jgi:hypothetical protein
MEAVIGLYEIVGSIMSPNFKWKDLEESLNLVYVYRCVSTVYIHRLLYTHNGMDPNITNVKLNLV